MENSLASRRIIQQLYGIIASFGLLGFASMFMLLLLSADLLTAAVFGDNRDVLQLPLCCQCVSVHAVPLRICFAIVSVVSLTPFVQQQIEDSRPSTAQSLEPFHVQSVLQRLSVVV